MFIGHYGVSLAAKRWAPRLSLGWLFLAVQMLDVLFATFVLLGVEKMAIVPGFTAYNPYDLFFMPYSHSLLGALAWSVLFGLLTLALVGRKRAAAAVAIGAAVFSHWLLDVPMHTADMPLAGEHSTKIGLGLWHHRDLSLAAELVALWAGALVWLRTPGAVGRHRANGVRVSGRPHRRSALDAVHAPAVGAGRLRDLRAGRLRRDRRCRGVGRPPCVAQ